MSIKRVILLFFVVLLGFAAVLQGQTLIVEAKPEFSENGFVQNSGYRYMLAEIQDIRTAGTQFDRITNNSSQYQDFYFIRHNGYVEVQINVPVSGNYNIFTRLVQHGNDTPRARVYVDGSYKNQISGNHAWGETSAYLHAGTRTIRYEEAGTGRFDWPYRLVGFDAVAVTNDLNWSPPSTLSTHPYTGNTRWWARPSAELSQIQVSVGGRTATYSGKWNYTDMLLVDNAGKAQGTAVDFAVSGQSLAGQNLSNATVSNATAHRVQSGALITDRSLSRMTPNYDMIDDEVEVTIPSGQHGYIQVKRYNGTSVRQMDSGKYTWDGRSGNNIYSDFAQRLGYLLEFTPTSGGSTKLLSCVYSDPDVAGLVRPRVREISPNGDDVYDEAEVYLNKDAGFNFYSSDSVVVRNSSGTIIRNLPKNANGIIIWNGTDSNGNVVNEGTYSIEILNSSGNLRAGSRINVLDLPPTGQEPHDPGDFFILGMWLASNSTSSADLDDIVAINCNAIRHPHSGTYPWGSSRSASSWWSNVESRNLKVLVNLAQVVHPILDMPMAPSELHLEQLLAPYVNPIKNKSALLGYELIDEPHYNEEWGYRLRAIQQVLHRLDPDRPSVPVLIGMNDRISGYTSDMQPHQLLLDVYPANSGSQPGNFLNIYGYGGVDMLDYMDWGMAHVEPRGVPTWIIHQAHNFYPEESWGLREPTPEEIGLQVWLSLTRAITGSFFFIYETQQTWTGVKDNPPIKAAITDIYGRLSQPNVYSVLPNLQKDDFSISISGGGNSWYSTGEAKPLTDGTRKYIIAVNRNCTSSSNITLNSSTYPDSILQDLETGTEYDMGLAISFPPGDGKIFKVVREDVTVPQQPQNLNFTDVTETRLRLNWDQPNGTSVIDGYNVYDGVTGNLLATTDYKYYSLDELDPGQTYCFFVTAFNYIGESDASAMACQDTYEQEPPTMPSNVVIGNYGSTYVTLDWDSSYDNVAVKDYDVFRDGLLIDTVSGTSYLFGGLSPDTRYEFQVKARDVDGNLSVITPAICTITCEPGEIPVEMEGYWKFDKNEGNVAYDASTYGRDGIINNASWTTGYYDSALLFNGSDSNVDLGTFEVIGNELTIAAWIRADGFNFGGENRILSKATGIAEDDHYWMLSPRRSGSDYFMRFRLKTTGVTHTLQGSSQTISSGQWYHVAATYDGTVMKLYVNGVIDAQTVSKSGNIDNGENVSVFIGANPDGTNVWNGAIDDVRIYSYAMSDGHIQDIMNGNEPLPGVENACTMLVGDFNCDRIVNMADYAYIANYWGYDTFPGLGNITGDGFVDFHDLAEFALHWLDEN